MPLPYLNRLENQLRLTGTMPMLHWERFRPTEGANLTFIWWCLSICAYSVIAALGIDAFRFDPRLLFFLLAADIFRWWLRFSAGEWYVPRLKYLVAPWAMLLITALAIPMVAHLIHPLAWWGTVIGILAWRVIRVGQKVRNHYLDYALEHESLSVENRKRWKALRSSDWQGDTEPQPHRALSESDSNRFQRALLGLRGQGRDEILYAIVAAVTAAVCMKLLGDLGYVKLRERGLVVACSIAIAGIGIWTLLFLRAVGSFGELWQATWHALHVFCHSPGKAEVGARAPWSERSRYGDAENRQAYLVWNLVGVTLLVLAATVFYPLVSDPLRDGKLGQYPLTGTLGLARLLELRFDRILDPAQRWLYFGSLWVIPPMFVATGLMSIVGGTAHGARVLFENDDALEHE